MISLSRCRGHQRPIIALFILAPCGEAEENVPDSSSFEESALEQVESKVASDVVRGPESLRAPSEVPHRLDYRFLDEHELLLISRRLTLQQSATPVSTSPPIFVPTSMYDLPMPYFCGLK